MARNNEQEMDLIIKQSMQEDYNETGIFGEIQVNGNKPKLDYKQIEAESEMATKEAVKGIFADQFKHVYENETKIKNAMISALDKEEDIEKVLEYDFDDDDVLGIILGEMEGLDG